MKVANPLLAVVSASLLLSQGCSLLRGEVLTINACRKSLRGILKDPESYREITSPQKVQEHPGNPPVFGWEFNAKNSFGGYGEPMAALCYKPKGEEELVAYFGPGDTAEKRNFLAATNPEIQREIKKEKEEMDRFLEELEASRVAKDKEQEKAFNEISRFCGHWLGNTKKPTTGSTRGPNRSRSDME